MCMESPTKIEMRGCVCLQDFVEPGAVYLQKHTVSHSLSVSFSHTDLGVCVIISKSLSFSPAKIKWQNLQITLPSRGITVPVTFFLTEVNVMPSYVLYNMCL